MGPRPRTIEGLAVLLEERLKAQDEVLEGQNEILKELKTKVDSVYAFFTLHKTAFRILKWVMAMGLAAAGAWTTIREFLPKK